MEGKIRREKGKRKKNKKKKKAGEKKARKICPPLKADLLPAKFTYYTL
jgi:hypothetical protein